MSSRGMKYIFVLSDYDSNAILAAPMKSRKGADMVKAFDKCYQQLKNAGITPILQYLDNEVSKELIAAIKENKLPSTSNSATANGSTKVKLSNTMPVTNYTKSSMKTGMQKNCPMKKSSNIQKPQLIH